MFCKIGPQFCEFLPSLFTFLQLNIMIGSLEHLLIHGNVVKLLCNRLTAIGVVYSKNANILALHQGQFVLVKYS